MQGRKLFISALACDCGHNSWFVTGGDSKKGGPGQRRQPFILALACECGHVSWFVTGGDSKRGDPV